MVVQGVDLVVLPLLNPDGREHVFAVGGDPWWRKNRSHNPGTGCRGTDLNRNYDFLWPWTIGQTSANPCQDTFKGAAVFSEPETRNVRWLFDTYPNIVAFADIHSYSQLILYPWGDDDDQTVNPTQNFQNSAWDGQRGVLGSGYGEHITGADLAQFIDLASRVRDAIQGVRGRAYTVEESNDLYPTSGVSSDYAYSRSLRPGGATKVWGLVIETNSALVNGQIDWQYGFQPPYADATQVMDEVSSGLMRLLLTYAWATVPDVRELRLTPAVQQVVAAGLVPKSTGASGSTAWVYQQSPAAGTRVAAGSTVTLSLRTGPIP